MQSSDEEKGNCTPPQISKAAEDAKLSLLPTKSNKIYDKLYDEFVSWCNGNNVKNKKYTEYFLHIFWKNLNLVSPLLCGLWSYYSMLKATLNVNDNRDISKYTRLISLLKRKSDGYKPKKSKILSRAEIELFLREAPDDLYLMMKVALFFGICGACRREELANITVDDILDLDTFLR